MIQSRRRVMRYLVWESALAVCGCLLSLKTTKTSPVDILLGCLTGAVIGLVVAECIDTASGLIKHFISPHFAHISIKLKIFVTIMLSIIAALVWIRVVQILFIGLTKELP